MKIKQAGVGIGWSAVVLAAGMVVGCSKSSPMNQRETPTHAEAHDRRPRLSRTSQSAGSLTPAPADLSRAHEQPLVHVTPDDKLLRLDPMGATADDRPAMDPITLAVRLRDAVYRGDIDQARAIFHAGADADTRDATGLTMLHIAARRGHVAMAQLLVDQGANVNAVDGQLGATPLHWAANEGHGPLVQFLLDCGAQVNTKDRLVGATPRFFAQGKGHQQVVELLKAHRGR